MPMCSSRTCRSCNVGDKAEVVDASNPDRKVMAKVTRMTGELDPRARAMQIEVNIDNSDGFLASGSFAYVTIHIPIKSYPQIPVSGLIVRGADSFVAVLDNDVLRFKPIKVASTDGNTISVAEGLQVGRADRDQSAGRGQQRQPGPADRRHAPLASRSNGLERAARRRSPRAHENRPRHRHAAQRSAAHQARRRRPQDRRSPPATSRSRPTPG